MAIEYLLVVFPEQRNVFADGAGVGVTNHILMLPGDEYQITLDGDGFAPDSQDVALNGTSLVRPLVIAFTATAASVAAAAPAPKRTAPTAAPGPAAPGPAAPGPVAPGPVAPGPAAPATAKPATRTVAAAPAKAATKSKKNA